MRVLYIITQGEQGGGQKNVLDLALGMKEKGHEVYLAVGEIENESDKWLFKELENSPFQEGGIKKENFFSLGFRYNFSFAQFSFFGRKTKENVTLTEAVPTVPHFTDIELVFCPLSMVPPVTVQL